MGKQALSFSTTTPGLAELDALTQDTLLLHHFVEDRPLRGLAGFADWRLNGWLSRVVLRGWTTGKFRETLLMPAGHRLPASRILLVGLGHRDEYTPERMRHVCLHTLEVLRKMRAASVALDLPGLDALKISSRQAVDMWLTAFHQLILAPADREVHFDVRFVLPQKALQDATDTIQSFQIKYLRR
jgi:hypothetical protein